MKSEIDHSRLDQKRDLVLAGSIGIRNVRIVRSLFLFDQTPLCKGIEFWSNTQDKLAAFTSFLFSTSTIFRLSSSRSGCPILFQYFYCFYRSFLSL